MTAENFDHITAALYRGLQKLPGNIPEKQAKRALKKYIARTDPRYVELSVTRRRIAFARNLPQDIQDAKLMAHVKKV